MGKNKIKGYFASRSHGVHVAGSGRSEVKTDYGDDLNTTNALSLLNTRIKEGKRSRQNRNSKPNTSGFNAWSQSSQNPEIWSQAPPPSVPQPGPGFNQNPWQQQQQFHQQPIVNQGMQPNFGQYSSPPTSTFTREWQGNQHQQFPSAMNQIQQASPWQNQIGPQSTVTSATSNNFGAWSHQPNYQQSCGSGAQQQSNYQQSFGSGAQQQSNYQQSCGSGAQQTTTYPQQQNYQQQQQQNYQCGSGAQQTTTYQQQQNYQQSCGSGAQQTTSYPQQPSRSQYQFKPAKIKLTSRERKEEKALKNRMNHKKIKKAYLLDKAHNNYASYLDTFLRDRQHWEFDQELHDWLIKNILTRVEHKHFDTFAQQLEFLKHQNSEAGNVLLLRQILVYAASRYKQLPDLMVNDVQSALPKIQRLLNIVATFDENVKDEVITKKYLEPLMNTKVENFIGTEFDINLIVLGKNNLTKRLEEFERRQSPSNQERKLKVIDYLNKWENDRDNWVFSKGCQFIVHESMFFPDVISDELFDTALMEIEYMLGLDHEPDREACQLHLARCLKCRINRQKYSKNEVDEYDQMEINRSALLFKIVEEADRERNKI